MSEINKTRFPREELSAMTDHELRNHYSRYKGLILEASKKNCDTHDLEIECCYLQRELMNREKWSRGKK